MKGLFFYFLVKGSKSRASLRFWKLSEAVHRSLSIQRTSGGTEQPSVLAGRRATATPLVPHLTNRNSVCLRRWGAGRGRWTTS